jgi:ATP-dependent DNA helicase RecG
MTSIEPISGPLFPSIHVTWSSTLSVRAPICGAIGEKRKAVEHVERAFERQPGSGALAAQLIEYAHGIDEAEIAQRTLDRFDLEPVKTEGARPYLTLARLLIDRQLLREGMSALARLPNPRTISDTMEAAILKKRSRDFQGAHRLFAEAYALNPDDPRLVQEYAQTKLQIARATRSVPIKKKLNNEAAELLRRAIQLSDDSVRSAWCWYDLARTLDWLRAPKSEVDTAFLQASSLHPNEPKFEAAYQEWQKKSATRGS